jgi:hypothetical protein
MSSPSRSNPVHDRGLHRSGEEGCSAAADEGNFLRAIEPHRNYGRTRAGAW